MKTIFEKCGDSLAIRFPKSFLDKYNLQEGSQVEVFFNEGKIVIESDGSKVREGWDLAFKHAEENPEAKSVKDFENEDWTW